jgi:hypothetical protein
MLFCYYMNSIRLSLFLGLSCLLSFTFFLGSCRSVAEYRGTRAPSFASPYRVAAVEKSWMARHKYDHDRRLLIPVHKGTRWGAVQEYKEDGTIVFRDWWVRNVKVEDLEANPETDVVKAEKPEPASLSGGNSFVPASAFPAPTFEPSSEPFSPNPVISSAPEPAPFAPEPFPVVDGTSEIAPFALPPSNPVSGGIATPSPFTPLPGAVPVPSAPLPGTAMPPAAFPNPDPGAPPGLGLPVMEQPLVPPLDPGAGQPIVPGVVPGGGNAPMPANPFAPAPGGPAPVPGNPPAMENPFPPAPGGGEAAAPVDPLVPAPGGPAPDPVAPVPIEANPFAPAPGGPAPGGGNAPMPANPFAPAPGGPAPMPVPGGEAPLPADPFGPAVNP